MMRWRLELKFFTLVWLLKLPIDIWLASGTPMLPFGVIWIGILTHDFYNLYRLGMAIRREYKPTTVSHPGKTLADYMEEQSLGVNDFEDVGLDGVIIHNLIHGNANITAEIAVKLEAKRLGASREFWINRQKGYDEYRARSK